jgi:RNA polymerase sigma factor for flagellar operon FliA
MSKTAKKMNNAKSELSALDQNELVTTYAPLVKRIAYHLMTRLPPAVQVDDLIQSGMIGLLDASRNYDPSQGASFETYAGIRIRGAMLDEIRKGDWAPRSLHRRIREISKVVNAIENEKGRDARDSEIAARLGMDMELYYETVRDASSYKVFSFEDLPSKEDALSEGLTDRIPEPLESLEQDRFQKALADAIASLPERERLVMSLYYKDELNLRETGAVMGVSESRVCQIHSQAVVRLKAKMAGWRP